MTRTTRTAPVVIALLAAQAACASAPATRSPDPGRQPAMETPPLTLAEVVDSVAAAAPLERTHWGVAVYDATADRVVFERNARLHFIPASNQKVVTMASATALLGPDYRYRTPITAEGVEDGVAARLVIRGSGDPSLSEHFHGTPLAALDSMADSLVAMGLHRVAGPLVIDQSRFERALTHPAWERGDLDWYYAAPVTAFAVSEGSIPVAIHPAGSVGLPARVEVLAPAVAARVDARIATAEGERGWDDELQRLAAADSVIVRGTVGVGADPDTAWIAQVDPGTYAGRALAAALEARGVSVEGPVDVRYEPVESASVGEAIDLVWRSAPMLELVKVSLQRSDNWLTEQVLKSLGAELGEAGSWSQGTAVVERFLADSVGIPEGALYVRDGSGLTAQNLVAPDAMVTLLRYVRSQPWGEAFRSAMAEPREEHSTLEERLEDLAGRLWAKTGTIRHVNTLSGYLVRADGHELVFSILTNASGRPSSEVRSAIDRIVEAMYRSGG